MQIKYLRNNKNEIELELDNLTIAELLRAYLNKDDSVILAAWRKEHPSKNPKLIIKTKNKPAKKALNDTISLIERELNALLSDFKKAK